MRLLFSLILVIAVVNLSSIISVAKECEYLNGKNICWEDSKSATLGWTYPKWITGGYTIEVSDFDWSGSVSIRVTKNGLIRTGIVSEGESYLFDFSNGSGFEGIKIIGDKISNINIFPPNVGKYPVNPVAKITVRIYDPEIKKRPSLLVSISTQGEQKAGSKITAIITTQNSGDTDIVDTELAIGFDDLEPVNEYEFNNDVLAGGRLPGTEIIWENVSTYSLTPIFPSIVKNGFFIKVLNFSNNSALISATYNFSIQNATLSQKDSVIFNFNKENDYSYLKILSRNITSNSADLVLQFPKKNILKQKFISILPGSSESIRLEFMIPRSTKKIFSIAANAIGKDREGTSYTSNKTELITVSDTLNIEKMASDSILGQRLYPESNYRGGNIRGITNITYVTIMVENLQNYPVYGVQLLDTIPSGFINVDDPERSSIVWNFDIKAKDIMEFTYQITAGREGVYSLPNAQLSWNEWGEFISKDSNAPRTQVSGPYINFERSFNKSIINKEDTLQISLSIINNGDVPTQINVAEILPENMTFLSGNLSFSGYIRPGEVENLTYNVVIHEANIVFKQPEITSKNTGFEWYAPVDMKKISVSSPSVAVTAEKSHLESMTQVTVHDPINKGIIQLIGDRFPWLEGTVPILMILLGISFLLIMKRTENTGN